MRKITTTLKCGSCHYFNERKTCVKTSLSSVDINRGAYAHTLKYGIIKLDKIKTCPMRISREEGIRQLMVKEEKKRRANEKF